MSTTVVIPRRYCGPPDSGNGGWCCGMLAAFVDGDAVVTLRRPPPLETALAVDTGDGGVRLTDGENLVAEAVSTTIEAEPPPFVGLDEAVASSERYAGHLAHPFPSCFTCGTARAEGDGLRVFPGPVEGSPTLRAGTWTPDESLAHDGTIPDTIVWAALDCPSGWTHLGDGTVAVLGRMAARVERSPVVGETYVVVGQATGAEGRRRFATSGLFDVGGTRLAFAEAIWITVDP